MEIKFRGNILEVEDARIIYRNFSGAPSKFNREGDRNFSLIIPNQELCDQIMEAGYNVKIKEPNENFDEPFMHLPVKVKYIEGRGPGAYLESGNSVVRLNEETIGMLDDIDIAHVSLDIRPYNWEVNGKAGISAYLQAIKVVQNIDRFEDEYYKDGRFGNEEIAEEFIEE